MDFAHDEEQAALRDAVRGLVGKAHGDHEHRRSTVAQEPGFDEELWSRMAEMGLLGLPFAEADGGVGAGAVEVGLVCRELGRVAAPEPYLPAVVLAGGLVAACGTAAQRAEVLGGLTEGRLLPAPALLEPGSRWESSAHAVTATPDGDDWTLSGTKRPVLHGERADLLVVSAALPGDATGLFLVDGDAATVCSQVAPDGTRAARVDLDATPATPLGHPGHDVTSSIATVLDLGRVMLANQVLGAMQAALRATTDYLTSRKQFGVPLNTFQALTFRAADMYVSLELTHSVVDWATMVADTGDPEALADAARRVALQASRGGRHVGQEAIQLHGGIAMTAEYAVGSLVSHLTVLDQLLGNGDHHLAGLAATVTDHAMVEPLG